MVANIFRKTNFMALLLGGLFCFSIFICTHFNKGQFFSIKTFLSSATNALILIFLLFLLLLLENKYRHFSIRSLHSLSLPLVVMFLPSKTIEFMDLLILFLLVLTFHNLALLKEAKNTKRALFNTQFLLSTITVLNPIFLPLFLCSLLIFISPRFQTFSYVLLFLFPIATLLFLGITIKEFISPNFFDEAQQKFSFSEPTFSIDVILWIVLIGATFFMQFTNRLKERFMGFGIANYFLFFLVIIALFSELYLSNNKLNFSTLSILPICYVMGNFFEQSKNNSINIISLLMIAIKSATFIWF